jgi:hypothetical protein
MSHILKRNRFVFIVVTILLLVLVTSASAEHCQTVQGLVFIDDNLNGVWDEGEAGYGGEMQTVEEDDGWQHDRYVGATVTIYTPAYDDFVLESAGYRELGEDEEYLCCHQDAMLDEDEVNPSQKRPCIGTWGLPGIQDDIRLEVWVTAPEGYVLTSANPQYFITGEDSSPLEFGLAPVEKAKDVSNAKAADDKDETTAAAYSFSPKGTGFVHGLVYLDENENGVWDVGETGYGGSMQMVEEDDGWMHEEFVGAELLLISPAYDEVEITSAPYKEPDEDDKALCTPQDFGEDDALNEHPMRPCMGTWGITQAGNHVTWEIRLTVPEGYKLTSPNPQYYTTGSGDPFVDFGIVPIDAE